MATSLDDIAQNYGALKISETHELAGRSWQVLDNPKKAIALLYPSASTAWQEGKRRRENPGAEPLFTKVEHFRPAAEQYISGKGCTIRDATMIAELNAECTYTC